MDLNSCTRLFLPEQLIPAGIPACCGNSPAAVFLNAVSVLNHGAVAGVRQFSLERIRRELELFEEKK